MISDETAALIEALLNPNARSNESRERYRKALEEFQADRRRDTEAAVSDAGLDPAMEQHRTDERLVEQAIREHARAALRLVPRPPQSGEIWPDKAHAGAQWHVQRIQALQALPVAEAAALLPGREILGTLGGQTITVAELARVIEDMPNPKDWPRMSMVHGGRRYTLEVQRLATLPGSSPQVVEIIAVYLDGQQVTQYARCV